jgi:hypothetical protein
MNRTVFGPWGRDLNGDDFACALAALGVLQGSGSRPSRGAPTAVQIAARLAAIHARAKGALPWGKLRTLPPTYHDAQSLVAGWQVFRTQIKDDLRIEILSSGWEDLGLDRFWILDQLWRRAVGIMSAYLAKAKRSPNTRWHWPLRVGFLPDRQSTGCRDEIAAALASASWARQLTALDEVSGPSDRCDLLIIPYTVRSAVASVLTMTSPPQADCVVLLTDMDARAGQGPPLLDILDSELRTNAMALANPDEMSAAEWFLAFIASFSHDEPFDVALAHSLGKPFTQRSPVMLANRDWIAETRLARLASGLRSKLADPDVAGETITLPPPPPEAPVPAELSELRDRLDLMPGEHRLAMLASASLGVRGTDFSREFDAATTTALLAQAVAPALRRQEPMPPNRSLQAHVFDIGLGGSEPSLEPVVAFRAGSIHRIDVRVGMSDETWVSYPQRFPEELLPPSARGHRLTVVLSEPVLSPEPQVGHIVLPLTGSSDSASFYLNVGPDSTHVEARVVVLYRNRVLQTAILAGRVVREPREIAANERILFRSEIVVSAGMADLERQSAYDAALILNHTSAGVAQVMKVVDDTAELVSVQDLDTFVQTIEDGLARADWGSKDFRDITTPGTLQLLRFLAKHGSLLYRGITNQFLHGSLKTAQRIQIIAAKQGTHLPVEYMYSLSSPVADAHLCPAALEALRSGVCASDCAGRANPNQYVCPAGFWGINRVLEWHVYRPEARRELAYADFALQRELIAQRKRLTVLQRALLGASARADREVKGSIATLLGVVKHAGVPLRTVDTWEELKAEIVAYPPTLLILIAHTGWDATNKMPSLEIGTGDQLTLDQLTADYVHAGAHTIRPVVLLLGCDTAHQSVAFEGFISALELSGAAIVVASSTYILGHQATVLAGEFVRTLKQASGNGKKTFGDVMLDVRRSMLRQGYPMALSLSSCGDADWRL